MAEAYLAIGSNLGDKRENMRTAVLMLEESRACRIVAYSSLYATKPVGIEDQPDFLNAVVGVDTALSPRELLKLCLEIEERMGRKRTIRWGPRVIDIDVLTYDDLDLSEDDLAIPHPRMLERAFVLVPLAEIAPDLEVGKGLSAREAAAGVDRQGVALMEEGWWSG